MSVNNVCKYHDYCYIEMPEEGKNILKYNHGKQSMKVAFVIYANTESLLEKNRYMSWQSRKVINN